ncbi:hypothetical protein niasHS_015676 [Heterodera schachtii]|uniref:Transmembrane protein n=1 Tax=Heterodera schachtii TaxID=97005 RepID=A0ABD2HR22_HETSC
MCATAANRLATINNFGTFLNRWQCSPFNRIKGGTALTQFRTVRQDVRSAQFDDGKETKRKEEGDEYRHQSSSSSSASAQFRWFFFNDSEQQILQEFLKEFQRFVDQHKRSDNFVMGLKALIRDFNNKQMSSEFEIEMAYDFVSTVRKTVYCGIGLTILGVLIALRLLTRNAILPEHRAVVAQQHLAVTYNEFVQHFLAAGQVRMIYFYPSKCVAMAVLHPGAVIRGHPYHLSAVPIRLDPCIASGTNFLQGVEEAQNRLGIDPTEHVPVTIHVNSVLTASMLVLGWFILFVLLAKHASQIFKIPFKVKRKDGGS